jgi:hypothetical protein
LKTPYRDGTTQAAFDPVDFIARLAALVPKPRVNLLRYEHPLGHYLFSRDANPQRQIRKEATENVWLDSVRSTIQQWTDVNFSMTEADKMSP